MSEDERRLNAEEIIKALECCTSENGCLHCPYAIDGNGHACSYEVDRDALELIHQLLGRIEELEAAQTARVMTLEEVHEMAWDYCYLEEEVIKDNVFQKYCGKHRVKCITWPSIASCTLTFGDDAYGKRWRCWTQRPTEEQRRGTPWKE